MFSFKQTFFVSLLLYQVNYLYIYIYIFNKSFLLIKISIHFLLNILNKENKKLHLVKCLNVFTALFKSTYAELHM